MKLHLPNGLRRAVLSCFALFTPVAITLATSALSVGAACYLIAQSQAFAEDASPTNLYWVGEGADNIWDTTERFDWHKDSVTGADTVFTQGANVFFNDASTKKDIYIDSLITVADMTIDGARYTFTPETHISITVMGDLFVTGTGASLSSDVQMDLSASDVTIDSSNELTLKHTTDTSINSLNNNGTFTAQSDLTIKAVSNGGILRNTGDVDLSAITDTVTFTELDADTVTVNKLSIGNGSHIDNLHGTSELSSSGNVQIDGIRDILGRLSNTGTLSINSYLTVGSFHNEGSVTLIESSNPLFPHSTLNISENVTQGGTVSAYDMKLRGKDNTFDKITLTSSIEISAKDAAFSVGTIAGTASSISHFEGHNNFSLNLVGAASSLEVTGTLATSFAQLSGEGSLKVGGDLSLTGTDDHAIGALDVAGSLTTGAQLSATSLKASSITLGDALTVTGNIDASSLTSITIGYNLGSLPAIKANQIDFGSSTHSLSFNITDKDLLAAGLKDGDSYILAQLADASNIDTDDFTLNNLGSVQIGSAQFSIATDNNNIVLSMVRVGNFWEVAGGNGSWDDATDWTEGYSPSTPGSASADAILAGALSTPITITLGSSATASSVLVETQDGSSAYILKDGTLTTSSLQVTQGTLKLQSAEVLLQDSAQVIIGAEGVLDIDANSSLSAKELEITSGAVISNAGSLSIETVDGSSASITNTGTLTLGGQSTLKTVYSLDGKLITQVSSSVTIDTIENQTLTLAERSTLYTSNDVTLKAMQGEGTLSLSHENSQLTIANGSTGVVSGSVTAYQLLLEAGSTATFNTLSVDRIVIKGELSTNKSMLKADDLFPKSRGGKPTLDLSEPVAGMVTDTDGVAQTYYVYEQADAKWSNFTLSDATKAAINNHVIQGNDVLTAKEGDSLVFIMQESTDRLWKVSENFAVTKQEGADYSVLKPIYDATTGKMVSYSILDTVDSVYVDSDFTINLVGVQKTSDLLIQNLRGDAGKTLSIIGDGVDQATIAFRNTSESYAENALDVKNATITSQSFSDGSSSVLELASLNLNNAALEVISPAGSGAVTGAPTGLYIDQLTNVDENNNEADALVEGLLHITGTGTIYTGRYEDATFYATEDADLSLKAGAGLEIAGDSGHILITEAAGAQMEHIKTKGANVTLDLSAASAANQGLALSKASTVDGGSLTLLLNKDLIEAGVTQQATSGQSLTLTEDSTLILSLNQPSSELTLPSGSSSGIELVEFSAGLSIDINSIMLDATLAKYFSNLQFETEGNTVTIIASLRNGIYNSLALTHNGLAGTELLNGAISNIPATNTDLSAVLKAMDDFLSADNKAGADKLAAATAGAGVTSLGSAALSNIEGQLLRMRNRAGGFIPAGESNYWISAEGGRYELDSDGTAAGHNIDNWGGSIGADWGLAEQTSLGFAFTALYGDLDANSVDAAEGELDSYYLSLAAQHQSGKWQHRALMSWGLMDASLDRHVSHAGGSYDTSGDTNGYSFGIMYELGYDIQLGENSTLTPIFNAALVHSYLDGYTETGSDAALRVGEQSNTIATFGIGARIESTLDFGLQVGARALFKVDAGDRAQEADVSFSNVADSRATIEGAEAGPIGIELGVGASMPVGESGAIFIDASAELRDGQQNGNASVGYRLSF